MTVLSPMDAEGFAGFVESAVADYAADKVSSASWLAADALERSVAEFHELLPQGLATPNNHLFEIRESANGPTVGFLWFAAEDRRDRHGAYVYNVVIDAPYRRRGHASRAFRALEPLVAAMGLTSIGLHVFGHNAAAQALYAKLGYTVTGINMSKRIDARA